MNQISEGRMGILNFWLTEERTSLEPPFNKTERRFSSGYFPRASKTPAPENMRPLPQASSSSHLRRQASLLRKIGTPEESSYLTLQSHPFFAITRPARTLVIFQGIYSAPAKWRYVIHGQMLSRSAIHTTSPSKDYLSVL